MKKSVLLLIVLSTTLLTGCATAIFKADFQGWPSGSPAGAPPGSPSDDQITVQNSGNPVVSGSKLVFDAGSEDTAYFFSHPVGDPDLTRTIFWIGRLKSGDGPYTVLLSGENSPGTPFLTNPLELRFSNNEVKVIDLPPSNAVLHSHALSPNAEHRVFVSLRIKSGTYRITIQQATAPEIEFNGPLNPLTANWIKTHSRIILAASFLNASASDEYEMDDIIMRKKN
jgi:hypothetical protein